MSEPGAPESRILDAFEEAIVENGVQAASFARIAAIGGFHRTLVQHHFGTRASLTQALLDRLVDYYARRTLEVAAAAPVGERVAALLDWMLSSFGEGGPPRQARVVDAFVALAPTDPRVQRALQSLYAGFSNALASELSVEQPGLSESARQELAFVWVSLAFGRAGLDTLRAPLSNTDVARRACDALLVAALG